MTTEPTFADVWHRLLERLAARESWLIGVWTSCRRDLESILDLQSHPDPVDSVLEPDGFDLDAYKEARWKSAQRLLIDPIGEWERLQPYSRVLAAIESYDRRLEELQRAIPLEVRSTGAAIVETLSQHVPPGWRGLAVGLRRKPFAFPFRSLIAGAIVKDRHRRSRIEGEFLLAFALAAHDLKAPWEDARTSLDSSVAGSGSPAAAPPAADNNAFREHIQAADGALERWRSAEQNVSQRFASRLMTGVLWGYRRRPRDGVIIGYDEVTLRAEQVRATKTELLLEADLARSEDRIIDLLRRALQQLESELSGLTAELDGAIEWLRLRSSHDQADEFPRSQVDVVPAASRLAELDAGIREELDSLPQSAQILRKYRADTRRRPRWKQYQPRATLLQAYMQTGRGEIARLLDGIVEEHRKIFQGIERARQVVGFASETSLIEETAEASLTHEAVLNAISLLDFLREEPPEWRRSAASRLARILAAVFIENRLVMTRRRLGVIAYLAQQGFRRAVLRISRQAVVLLDRGLRHLWQAQERAGQRFRVYIGWQRAATAGKVQVNTRPYLPEELTIDVNTGKLSALYRYLFRAEAVQDPRFLVGRAQEMAAIAQARDMWEQARPAAIVIVGERGSGKTSLINCALKRWLDDLDIVCAEFSERIAEDARLHEFLARLAGVADPAGLVPALGERRRVIILEGLERLFVRRVGGYVAIRELQRLIAATCSSVLWIASINQVAFQFLDASVNLGRSFSHRINAGGISRDDLRQAIMERHNLSGLRLHFPDPPPAHKLHSRLRARVEGQTDPESKFFEILASQSAGIYRTAFNIWIGQVESIQAGALYLQPFAMGDPGGVMEDLSLDQVFALVAILQHGCLTPEEHATVFQNAITDSRAQMDELLAREIIEADPRQPGFRLRPEAMPLVKEALYRRNLL